MNWERSFAKLPSALRQIHWRYFSDLTYQLVVRELKLLYKRSFLGIAWTLIRPLLQLLVFYFVFNNALNLKVENYASFVLVGLLVWNWFAIAVVEGTGVIVANPMLVRQPRFPVFILPIIVVLVGMIHFLSALPVLLIFLLIEQVNLQPVILILPIIMALQFCVTVSLIYLLAAVNVTFRDTRYTIDVLLRLGFFLTPVFYSISSMPDKYQGWYLLNPMVHLLEAYRAVLVLGEAPHWLRLGGVGIGAIALLFFSQAFFRHQSHRFVEEL
ncbi:MAG: ABC transporter permease [Oscillatoria sp. PMC 1068.18]|nr:ABC transporter permease [Oscillatoria sp. PMC 1076.18]MEC4988171.1 ABC transporter permease [Oscillatoria sp. PMC 1068.18]